MATCEVRWPKVILYGDSITQRAFSYDGCWGSMIANSLIRKCDVINRGFGGYNTRWNKIMMPRILPASQADDILLVLVFLGANDSQLPGGHSAVPLDEFQINLVSIIDYLMAIGVKRDNIMMIDNGVVDVDNIETVCKEADGYVLPEVKNPKTMERSREYAHACVAVAKKWRVGYVNLYDNMIACSNWKDMLIDGVHFTHLGSCFLYKLLQPWIAQRTKSLPELMPDSSAIDADDPEKSLTTGGKDAGNLGSSVEASGSSVEALGSSVEALGSSVEASLSLEPSF